jgi:hypothetical protein
MNLFVSVSRLFRTLSHESARSSYSQVGAGQWQEDEIIEFWMERVVNEHSVESPEVSFVDEELERPRSLAQ